MRMCDGQISIFDTLPPIKDGLWDLPGFAEAREYLRSKGLPFGWVDRVVSPDEPGTVFVKKGIPFERSDCPEYEGCWLCGGFGSVRCRAVPFLLPGLQWDKTCSKDPERCQFRKR